MHIDDQKTKKIKETDKKEDKNNKEGEKGVSEESMQWKEKYLRALADYQNLDRRTHQERIASQKRAIKTILVKFLEVLDDIEQAAVFIKDQGLMLVKEKFVTILASEGVHEVKVAGKPYDPYTAECVEVVVGKKDTVVIEVLRKGYALGDAVIRPARVKVEKLAESE